MKKVLSIVGARPQFIKLAPISRLIRSEGWREIIVHTGQHYDEHMSGAIFRDLGLSDPDYNLGVGSGGHGKQTGRMLELIEGVLEKERPDLVVVFGDTNSTVAGALTAAKMGIPSVHVEAGLRSFNRSMPEEINRIVSDHVCDWLFAPTAAAVAHLKNEGLGDKAFLTGDIMVDAVKYGRDLALERSGIMEELGLKSGAYSVLTLHRPYTVDNPEVLGHLLHELAKLREPVIFPVHPRTLKTLVTMKGAPVDYSRLPAEGGTGSHKAALDCSGADGRIRLIPPVGYFDFLCLQCNAKRILTDSGGIQKEAYILRKPCVTLRPETEWVETVEAGWNLLLHPGGKELASSIYSFSPPDAQPTVFGSDVARGMVDIIRRKTAGSR